VPELYDVVADPQEKNNLLEQTATVAVSRTNCSRAAAESIQADKVGNSGLSPDALAKLSALGYVAYRSPVSPEALAAGLPDPRASSRNLTHIASCGCISCR